MITGIPNTSGAFTVNVAGYANLNQGGDSFVTTFSFPIVDLTPAITAGPTNQTANVGTSVTFTVAATGTSLKYRWLKNDIEISQAVTPTYVIPSVSLNDAGDYKVRVSNNGGISLSSPAKLTVSATPPTVVVTPSTLNVHEGETAGFTALVTGSGPFTYQWSKGSTMIGLVTNATLTFAGNYFVTVRNSGGGITNGPVVLGVFPRPQLGSPHPAGGGLAILSASAIAGRSYVLETQAALNMSSWLPEQTNSANGAAVTFTSENVSTPNRFWRVRVWPLAP